MKRILLIGLIACLIIISGCSSNTQNPCFDDCMDLLCNGYEQACIGEDFSCSCARDISIKNTFEDECMDRCGLK
ncbi:MAG: hypothetical protein ABH849_00680 [Nanoarchaeota archaeon]